MLTKDIKEYREKELEKQKWVCPLCGTRIRSDEATLDHSHNTGRIRCVLHRSCNSSEGRILHWARRSRATDPLEFLKALVKYWQEDFKDNPMHPRHGKVRKRGSRKKRATKKVNRRAARKGPKNSERIRIKT